MLRDLAAVKVQADKLEAREHNQWKVQSATESNRAARAQGLGMGQLQEKREARIAVMEEQPGTRLRGKAQQRARLSWQVPAQAAA